MLLHIVHVNIWCCVCRAKLSEWLASKGKTLKRPAMTASAPPKTKVFTKPKVEEESQSHIQPQPATGNSPKTKQSVQANQPDSAATAHGADPEEIPLTAQSRTPELLDNSDADVLMDDVRTQAGLFVTVL